MVQIQGWFFFFSSVCKSKELCYVLVKWHYMSPHIEGNKEGKVFPVQVGCHVEFNEYFPDVSFVKERDAM